MSESSAIKPADLLRTARGEALAGQYARAAELSRMVLVTQPNALIALRILAWAELELAQPTAREHFRACLSVDPEDVLAEVGLGIADEIEGKLVDAGRHFFRAYQLDPSNPQIQAELVRVGVEPPTGPLIDGLRCLHAGEVAIAADYLRQASAIRPPDPAARLALATAIWQCGARQQIENICLDILSTQPSCLKALLYLLAVAVEWKRSLQVRELLGRVAALDPGVLLSRDMLAPTGMADRVFGPAPATPAPARP